MKKTICICLIIFILLPILAVTNVFALADNPIVTNVRTADPAALVHNGRFYIVSGQDEVNTNEFNMYSWRLLSSADMNTWTDHGVILSPSDVSWLPNNRAWASQIVYRNGYFYFYASGDQQIGVLRSTSITGPYIDVNGAPLVSQNDPWAPDMTIDPHVFVDDDGSAYLWYGLGQCMMVELNSDMISLKGTPTNVPGLNSYLEAPYVFRENNTYFMMYADAPWPSEIRYATATNVNGPWTHRGIIGERTGNGTNHPGAAKFNGQWYYVYHTEELSNGNPYSRNVCVDLMTITGNTISPIQYTSFWLDSGGSGDINRIQSYNFQNRYVRHIDYAARIDANISPIGDSQWRIVPGLADSGSGYVSFESVNLPGYYLRHYNYELRLEANNGSSIFGQDATFRQVAGLANSGWSSFQSYNFPNRYIRHYNYELRIDPISTSLDQQDATFRIID